MTQVHGHCDPRFDSVRELLQSHLSSGNEIGASICVNVAGTDIIDLWGGYVDEGRSAPWTENTLVPVWSCSKCITNLSALLLVDRGLLDPYARVSQYWPEFAVNSKEDVQVRHFLSHSAGLPGWELPFSTEEMFDVALATERLAAQKPWWAPGTAPGYHVISQGHLVGELVRRISGKPLRQFIRDELATPRNADFQLGAVEKDWPRIAEVTKPEAPPVQASLDKNSIPVRAMRGTPVQAEHTKTPGFRNTEMGGANGISNARALNRILSIITLGGTVDGHRFLSPDTVDSIFREQSSGTDLVLGPYLRFGMGFGLPVPQTLSWIPEGKVCFWGGWGGSMVIMDLDRRVTITYAMNRMGNGTMGNDRSEAYVREIYRVLNRIPASKY